MKTSNRLPTVTTAVAPYIYCLERRTVYKVAVPYKGRKAHIGTFLTLQDAQAALHAFCAAHPPPPLPKPPRTRALTSTQLRELAVLGPIHGASTLARRYGSHESTIRTIMHQHGIRGPGIGHGDRPLDTIDCPWYWRAVLEDSSS